VEIGVGTTIGGYRLTQQIGQGGMGVVYLGESEQNGVRVAVKLLTPDLARQSGFRERFVREARYANSLRHPNVIEVYDAGEQEGVLYIVMQFVEGTDLKNLLAREGALAPGRAVNLLGQVAGALDAAHAQGLLHRDIKPGNIMISPPAGPGQPEHCFLADFGLSKNVSSDSIALTAQGEFVGTIDYTAPELVLGKKADSRLDVYSLGCLFFECLAGAPPFNKERDVEVLYAHIQDPPPTITSMRGDVPPALDDVIAKAMAKKPGDRFDTCSEFTDAARAVVGEPPPAPVAPPPPASFGAPPPPPGQPFGAPPPPAGAPQGFDAPPPPGFAPPPPAGAPQGFDAPPPPGFAPPPPAGAPQGFDAPPPPPMPPEPPQEPSEAFPASTMVLRVTGGAAMGTVIQVDDEFLIGRQAPGDGKLANDIEISRRHARLWREADGRFMIEDLGSTNGTYVNSQRVSSQALRPHDVIEMGDTRILVLDPREAPAVDEPAAPSAPPGVTTFAAVPADLTEEMPPADLPEAAAPEAPPEPVEAGEPEGTLAPEPHAPEAPAAPEPVEAEAPPAPEAPEPVEAEAAAPELVEAAESEESVAPDVDVTPPPSPVIVEPDQPTPAPQATPEPPPEPEIITTAGSEFPPPPAEADAPEPPAPEIEPPAEPAAPEVEPLPEPELPAEAAAAPRAVGVRLEMSPSGELNVVIDDPDGPVRVVKRDGTWVIDDG
jgi:serine/threonine-protein kinase